MNRALPPSLPPSLRPSPPPFHPTIPPSPPLSLPPSPLPPSPLPPQPRTEAFSAVPVGAQAYFNSQAGVDTLAIIPGGVATAASIAESKRGGGRGGGGSAGGVPGFSRVVRRRGYHARNKYTRVAKEDRLREEAAGRKRAREERESDGEGEEGGGRGEGGGGDMGRYTGEMGDARLKELLRLTQVSGGGVWGVVCVSTARVFLSSMF